MRRLFSFLRPRTRARDRESDDEAFSLPPPESVAAVPPGSLIPVCPGSRAPVNLARKMFPEKREERT